MQIDRTSDLYAEHDLRDLRIELFSAAEDMECQEKAIRQTRPDYQKQQWDHARRDCVKRLQKLVEHYGYLLEAR